MSGRPASQPVARLASPSNLPTSSLPLSTFQAKKLKSADQLLWSPDKPLGRPTGAPGHLTTLFARHPHSLCTQTLSLPHLALLHSHEKPWSPGYSRGWPTSNTRSPDLPLACRPPAYCIPPIKGTLDSLVRCIKQQHTANSLLPLLILLLSS